MAMFPTNCRTSSAVPDFSDKSGERGCNTIFCSRPFAPGTFEKDLGPLGRATLVKGKTETETSRRWPAPPLRDSGGA